MTYRPGDTWLTRGGELATVLEVKSTGHCVRDRKGRAYAPANLIICKREGGGRSYHLFDGGHACENGCTNRELCEFDLVDNLSQ